MVHGDLRSTEQRAIDEFEKRITDIAREEAERAGFQMKVEDVEEKLPAAQLAGNRESFTVRMSEAVHLAMGFENVTVTPTASNNANVALLAGLNAISTGAGPCGGDHSLAEWCEIEPFYRGVKKTILLITALAGSQ